MTATFAVAGSCPSTADVDDLLTRGDVVTARRQLDVVAERVGASSRSAHDVAQLYMRLGNPGRAVDFYARAAAMEPDVAGYRYNLSTALIALGRMGEAEAALDGVIATDPLDHDAWYNRATLRTQTPDRNHVAAIERQLSRSDLPSSAIVPLCYALAKELEDLGEFERSFAALTRGANTRRAMLSYCVEDDESIMRGIGAAFPEQVVRETGLGYNDEHPVFVVGLPRSGTTLVDRILSSHSRIGSHGESVDLAMSLMHAAGPCRDKTALLERSVRLDPHRLGLAYCGRLAAHAEERVVDKTPANFLYLGLVARALPGARIIYVRREAMDVCYAMYKTLFRMAYPYSYNFDDLGRYWLAFDALMRHWQAVLPPGRMLVVDYEQLVAAPEASTRAMLAHIGVAWEDACLRFDENPLPSLSASAAQVRRPIYRSSVGLWRHHAEGLAPLARRLREAGIRIDDEVSP